MISRMIFRIYGIIRRMTIKEKARWQGGPFVLIYSIAKPALPIDVDRIII